ncbi:MAG: type II secretion system F family protein [Deltaproteobacteria bacterium]|nr:type II secretion system F family protein [Deltaproteobacteria bacterium]
MPEYTYKARNTEGKLINGVMAAVNPEDLYAKLSGIGCYPTGFEIRKNVSLGVRKRVSRRDLITFTVHLGTILASGIPILTGLKDLLEQTEVGFFRQVIEDIHRNIEAGLSLSAAMAEYPQVFSELYVAMVSAGESTGKMEETFQSLTSYLEWQEDLMGQIKQATLYPIVVFWAIVGLVALIFTVVLPKFLVIFEKSHVALPLPTRIIISISHFMLHSWPMLLCGIFLFFLALRFIKGIPATRIAYDRLKLMIPVFGALSHKIILARFAHTFSSLYRSGVNIIHVLELMEKTTGNRVFERAVVEIRQRVQEGRGVAETMRETGLFPPLFVRMVSIGEETGSLDFTLEKLSGFYDREVPMTVKKVFGIMEPLIIVILGGIVGTVAMSVFLPLYKMMSVAGG